MTYSYINRVRNYPYPSTIEVYFSHSMLDNLALNSIGSYRINRGAYVTSVAVLDAESVRLTTENLFGYPTFTLSMGSGLISVDGYALDTSVTKTITLNNAEEGINALSAANGRLKSGQSAVKVYSDSDYFYVMTESGLDVVHRTSLFNKGYVLQESGFNTIFINGD